MGLVWPMPMVWPESSGLRKLPPITVKNADNSWYEASLSSGTRRPAFSKASVMTTEGPPVMAISPTPVPVVGLAKRSSFMTSSISSKVSAGMAPACRTIASQIAVGTARDPVCEEIARRPASLFPPFQMTTGFWGVTWRSREKKRRPSRTPSRYMPMRRVSSSMAR